MFDGKMKAKKSAAAAVGRRLVYRTAMLPAVLMLALVLPFLFIRTAFLVLESAALCSSSIGCITRRVFGGSDVSVAREELRKALLEAASSSNDDDVEIEKLDGGPISFKDLVRDFTSNKHDIRYFAFTTKTMIEKMERLVSSAKWQESVYWHLATHGVPNSLHCLSLVLAEEYAVNAMARARLPPPHHVHRLTDPLSHHVVLLTDNALAASVVVSSAVKASSNPGALVFHVVTDRKSYTSMHSWFALNNIHSAVIEIKGLHHYDLNLAVEEMLEADNHRRSVSLLNHLRMYLPQLFADLDKVVVLDDDVVVQRDLSLLWELELHGKVVGASGCGSEDCCKTYKEYLNFSHPIISSSFDQHRCGWLFGMNIFDLKQWRNSNITATYHKWLHLNLNSGYTLWRSGALPPALIAFENLVHCLDPSWHVAGLGQRYPNVEKEMVEAAAVVHFSGPAKPWLQTCSPEKKFEDVVVANN